MKNEKENVKDSTNEAIGILLKDEKQLSEQEKIDLIRKLRKERKYFYGFILLLLGTTLYLLSGKLGGTNVKDFVSGAMLGMSISISLIGIILVFINWITEEVYDEGNVKNKKFYKNKRDI